MTTPLLICDPCDETVFMGAVQCRLPKGHSRWHQAGGIYWKWNTDPADTLTMRCIHCGHEQPYSGGPAPRHCDEWTVPVNEETSE